MVKDRKAASKAYYDSHCEKLKADSKDYYVLHSEKLKAKSRAHYESHKEDCKAKHKAYQESHREERKVKAKAYRAKHQVELKDRRLVSREKNKAQVLLRKYGLTIEKYTELILGGCMNCGSHIRLHVDHDHSKPGTYRGILCSSCNTALGHLREDKQIILGLINYLERINEIGYDTIG